MINPGLRLKTAADLVRQGSRVVDIGTDHAYLPAYLVLSGRVVSAIACDIGVGPLENASKTVSELNLANEIELRLCNGLQGVHKDEVDDIVICGMGGELIASIIDETEWLKSADKHLILQPMSAVDDLRRYLANNGFCVNEEILVKDGRRLYIVVSVYYNGKCFEPKPEYLYVGNITADCEHGREYLEKQLKRVLKHADMLLNTQKSEERNRLLAIADEIIKRLERE